MLRFVAAETIRDHTPNGRSVHWDIAKDLRSGGRIELDGKIVQKNGVWVA